MNSRGESGLRLVYVTDHDITRMNGPGINERDFIHSLLDGQFSRLALILPHNGHNYPRGVEVHFIPKKSLIGMIWQQIRLLAALRKVTKQGRYDLVVTRLGSLPLALWAYSFMPRVPYAVKNVGDPEFAYLRTRGGLKGLLARLGNPPYKLLYGRILHNALAVDACTPIATQKNQPFIRDRGKVFLVDNAVNTNLFYPIDQREVRRRVGVEHLNPIIGIVAGLPWEKGGQQIIRAVHRLREKFPHLGALIVGGSGKGLDGLKSLAKELGLSERCVITGYVPYHEVHSYINCFDVGLAMSSPEIMKIEGNANLKIRAYLACGVPVITNHGSNPFVGEQGLGSYCDWGDEEAFLATVLPWLELGPSEREAFRMRANAYARQELSTTATLRQRIAIWQEALLEASQEDRTAHELVEATRDE